jgi:hypothetical protein
MADWQRERLYGEIRRRLAERPDRTLRRHWGAALHVARRREPADDSTDHLAAFLGDVYPVSPGFLAS